MVCGLRTVVVDGDYFIECNQFWGMLCPFLSGICPFVEVGIEAGMSYSLDLSHDYLKLPCLRI